MAATAEPGSVGVPDPRSLPVPSSVSAEAQAFLSFAGAPDGSAYPALDDIEAWHAYIANADTMIVAALEMQTAQLAGDVKETNVAGVPVFVVVPDGVDDGLDHPVHLDIHGGGLVTGGGACCRAMALIAASRIGLPTWSVDYRMPPDHPYPAALDDCLTVYRAMLEQYAPDRIVIGGGSAGGNLAAALTLRAQDEGLPMPGALVLLTPEVDLTESGDSFQTNLGVDNVLTSSLAAANLLYAGGHDLSNPYLSPLFGEVTPSFPPTFLQSGTRDLFLSNTVRMHRKLRAAGVDAELHVFEAMPHGGFFGAPEDQEMAEEIRRFVAVHLGR